eukprot:SM000017S02833  [mRNA]  locus=s17:512202:517378:- [translate_table: standard]
MWNRWSRVPAQLCSRFWRRGAVHPYTISSQRWMLLVQDKTLLSKVAQPQGHPIVIPKLFTLCRGLGTAYQRSSAEPVHPWGTRCKAQAVLHDPALPQIRDTTAPNEEAASPEFARRVPGHARRMTLEQDDEKVKRGVHFIEEENRTRPPEWQYYDPEAFAEYYKWRPLLLLRRAVLLLWEAALLQIGRYTVKDIKRRADNLRCALIRLGPFYVKLGQALSTRPDFLPPEYCFELAKLQDQIPPFPTPEAIRYLEHQLGAPVQTLFQDISPTPVAAASLGQVYKAHLPSGEVVAVKVQRPGMATRLALDAHLLRTLGSWLQKPWLQKYLKWRSDVVAIVDEMVGRMFEEVDYVKEANNAERFARLYAAGESDAKGNDRGVKVPSIYWDLTSRGVLTMEWVDGIKLTDHAALAQAHLNTQQLGVLCSLKQLLEEGFFHADPHPGNLVVTHMGQLAYFDFGMMSEMRREYRIGLIRTLVHFVNRDALGLARDFEVLGFLPLGSDLVPVARALRESFGVEGSRSNMDFQGIITQLSTVMQQFNFRLPAEFAMVIRALGSLEGTATTLDPEFKVVASAYPFIVGRLLSDPDPEMRSILLELLFRPNGSIRWGRLERLVTAVAGTASPLSQQVPGGTFRRTSPDEEGIRGSFDRRAVASATSDMLDYVFSEAGRPVRTVLVRDVVGALDSVLKESWQGEWLRKIEARQWQVGLQSSLQGLQESLYSSGLLEHSPSSELNQDQQEAQQEAPAGQISAEGSEHAAQPSGSLSEQERLVKRLILGLQAAGTAVGSAPELWLPLLADMIGRPEARKTGIDIGKYSVRSYKGNALEAAVLYLSKALHQWSKKV